MADVQIRSFEEEKAGEQFPKKVWELRLADQINGKDIEFKQRYDVEPTNEQRAKFEGEAQQHFEREARRLGVPYRDSGVTPVAQPVTGPTE